MPRPLLELRSCCLRLCPFYNVGQKHGTSHRPSAAWHGSKVPCNLDDLGSDVADQSEIGSGDADIEHGSTRLDGIGGDECRDASSSDDDVGTRKVRREVAGAGMAQRDSGVLATASKKQSQRA